MKTRIRVALGLSVVLLTIVEFTYYLSRHSNLLKQLTHTRLTVIAFVLILNVAMLGALALIMQASLRLCDVTTTMKLRDNLLLNVYSLFVNFFIIGQAGPGVRAVYLKKYYNLLVRRYIFVTLLYYGCYALISSLLILTGSRAEWWSILIIVVAVLVLSAVIVRVYAIRSKLTGNVVHIRVSSLSFLLLATIVQALIQVCIYAVELHSVDAHIAIKQILAYTGVANFALFVGLTPGAIGIRESFLVFSEKLHHISSANIVTANIIDRGVYLSFLGILFVIIITTHIKSRFTNDKSTNDS